MTVVTRWGSAAKTVKPVPKIQNQVGPTCGLYALSIVMRFWYDLFMEKHKASPLQQPNPPLKPARDPSALSQRESLMKEIRDAGGKPTPYKPSGLPTFHQSMLDIAETMGSRIGEVAEAKTLARIARASGAFDAKVLTWDDSAGMMDIIRAQIDRNCPCIIGYDNTNTGDPGKGTEGDRAHWAVVFGYVEENGVYSVLATHGWGRYYKWVAEDLRESNEQMTKGWHQKEGTWVQVERSAGGPAWDQRQKVGTGYDLSVHVGWDGDPVTGLRAYAPIRKEQDLVRQIVIVTPMGESDLSPPRSLVGGTVTAQTSGGGDRY